MDNRSQKDVEQEVEFLWESQEAWPMGLQNGLHISVVAQDGEGRVEGQQRESNEVEDEPVPEGSTGRTAHEELFSWK